MVPTFLLGACGTTPPSARDDRGPPAISGNHVRDWIAGDLRALHSSAASKDEVFASLGGKVTRITEVSALENLAHSELSTLDIPLETLDEWRRLFSGHAETWYVMAEGGNDVLLFFNKDGALAEYAHM